MPGKANRCLLNFFYVFPILDHSQKPDICPSEHKKLLGGGPPMQHSLFKADIPYTSPLENSVWPWSPQPGLLHLVSLALLVPQHCLEHVCWALRPSPHIK